MKWLFIITYLLVGFGAAAGISGSIRERCGHGSNWAQEIGNIFAWPLGVGIRLGEWIEGGRIGYIGTCEAKNK